MSGSPKRVLFATIAAGGGHVATASALADALAAAYPGEFSTRVSDVMAEYGAHELDRRHKDGWKALLRRPYLVRSGQRVMDVAPALVRLSQRRLLAPFANSLAAALLHDEPDLIVANHGWLTTVFALARERHGLKAPVVVYATEPFDASALWAEPGSELVLAPSVAAKQDLVRLGVPAPRVHVAGYPVGRSFLDPPPRAEARAQHGVGLNEFTVLVSLGAEGVATEALSTVEGLLATGATVLAVAGRNSELEHRLRGLAAHQPRLKPFGFTGAMAELLAAADVVVGKAGPASTMEALAVGRPVLVTSYAGLNEAAVVRFLEAQGVGEYVPGARLAAAVSRWRASPHALAAAERRAKELGFPRMATRLAAHLRAAANGEAPPKGPPAPGPFEAATKESLARARPVAPST